MPVQYSYTSTPPIGRTAFTEPQCLYSTAIPLLPPKGRTACTEPQCLYSRTILLLPQWAVRTVRSLSACTVELYLYSPQCLYSTPIPLLPSVPVQYSYTSTPLSACTVQLYLYSPYGPYALYRASVPVQGCTLLFTLFSNTLWL